MVWSQPWCLCGRQWRQQQPQAALRGQWLLQRLLSMQLGLEEGPSPGLNTQWVSAGRGVVGPC